MQLNSIRALNRPRCLVTPSCCPWELSYIQGQLQFSLAVCMTQDQTTNTQVRCEQELQSLFPLCLGSVFKLRGWLYVLVWVLSHLYLFPALPLLSLSWIRCLCFLAWPQTCMDIAGNHRSVLWPLTPKPLLFLHSYCGQCPSWVRPLPCHPWQSCLPFQGSLPLLSPRVTGSVPPHQEMQWLK